MTDHKEPGQLKGFYGKAKVSVRTLDIIIVAGIIAMIIVLSMGMKNSGFTISFDSQGGTYVESQKLMYGDHVTAPADPTREGYEFVGWFRDRNGQSQWNIDNDTVVEAMTLYAIWTPVSG